MEIHLPDDLQRFVHDQVLTGRFSSEDEVIREALEQFKRTQKSVLTSQPTTNSWLGSMREGAELLDEIAEEAMRIRAERPWRLPPVNPLPQDHELHRLKLQLDDP
jgi:Arc/MetJ-type ribon-helix-helix transcriptional regulator